MATERAAEASDILRSCRDHCPRRQAVEPKGLKFESPGQRPGSWGATPHRALKGRYKQVVAPFQGFGFFANPVPRASPWAGESQPFELDRRHQGDFFNRPNVTTTFRPGLLRASLLKSLRAGNEVLPGLLPPNAELRDELPACCLIGLHEGHEIVATGQPANSPGRMLSYSGVF